MSSLRIGLIGDFDPKVIAHRAIPEALALAAQAVGYTVEPAWLPTDRISLKSKSHFARFAGLWCVPASPYADMDGALHAIRFARERPLPFLGTCGGFQHALIEFARHVAGIAHADHEETNPAAASPVINRLACSLVEQIGVVRLREGSRARAIFGREEISQTYHCSYGVNRAFAHRLECGGLKFTGHDTHGEQRVLELEGHPFFLATLFQPERSASHGVAHPLICAFVRAMHAHVEGRTTTR